MTELPLSILTLGPDDVALVRMGKLPDNPEAAQRAVSIMTAALQAAFRPDQMRRVIVIPYDTEVIKLEIPRETAQ